MGPAPKINERIGEVKSPMSRRSIEKRETVNSRISRGMTRVFLMAKAVMGRRGRRPMNPVLLLPIGNRKMKNSELYVSRQKQMERRRLVTSQKWCFLVSAYYFARVCLIILPKWSNHNIGTQISEITQLAIFVFCVAAFILTWLKPDHLELIKYVLFSQILQMQLSNIKVYRVSDCADSTGIYHNYEGLNMLSAVFSVIFTL